MARSESPYEDEGGPDAREQRHELGLEQNLLYHSGHSVFSTFGCPKVLTETVAAICRDLAAHRSSDCCLHLEVLVLLLGTGPTW
mmetsp:Transcript_3578/g.6229  ORF Transcript_3578/g.6229 Transcript_3578/m.6229 type:complete len:84 (+) Transcript_3578:233-484(+)